MQEPPFYGPAEDHRALLPSVLALHSDYVLRSMQQVMRELLSKPETCVLEVLSLISSELSFLLGDIFFVFCRGRTPVIRGI